MPKVYTTPVAKSVPFDNTTNGFTSSETQGAIEEIAVGGGTGVGSGLQFTRSGNVSRGAYLQVGSVPSNLTGAPVGLFAARIVAIVITNELSNTFTCEVEEHDGTSFVSLGTFSLTSQRYYSFTGLSILVTAGKEIAIKVSSGSAKNIVVNIYVKGNSV